VENGKLSLDADYVSYWGVAQQVSTIFPQVLTAIATDRYGRRLGNWLYLGFACITIILEMVARNWQTWLVARLFAGITFGFVQAGPLTLMSEIVMPQMRGNVVGTVSAASPVRANASACLLLAQLGARHSVLFCWSANPQHGTWDNPYSRVHFVTMQTAPLSYRNIIYSEWILVGLFGICCVVTPESPRE
jgi:MFS family permease